MKSNIKNAEKSDKLWISSTGYRTLVILRALMEKGRTINELVDVIKNNQLISKAASKDNVRITVNTLRNAGCDISKPSKSNEYKYNLITHPFVLSISKEELSKLVLLRDKFVQNISLSDIYTLNNLYSKIAALTFDKNIIKYTEDTKPLKTIDEQIFKELSRPEILNKKIKIVYKSPQFGEEDIIIVPLKLFYENEKVYLWCYNYKYEGYGLLNLERIIKINTVYLSDNLMLSKTYDVVYELTGDALLDFKPKENETVINASKDKLTIKAVINNEFLFIQNILQFGRNFKIISPDFFKEKLINKIKLIQKGYINGKV